MISQHDTFFGSAYHAMYIDLPSGGNDYEVGGEYGCYQTSVGISPDSGDEYSVGFHSPDPGMALMSALLPTTGRYQLCVIERGTTYVGDVREPLSFTEPAETRGDGPRGDSCYRPRASCADNKLRYRSSRRIGTGVAVLSDGH